MICPICKNTMGFVCGTCDKCGYNQLKHKYDWIKVNVDILAQFVPEHILYALIETHEDMKKRK